MAKVKRVFNKDVYDKNGKLLVAKGVEILIDEERASILNSFNIVENTSPKQKEMAALLVEKADDTINSDNRITEETMSIIEAFKSENHISDPNLVASITAKIENIVYNQRDQPWYLHVNAIFNYVDWIYSHSINTALISGIIGYGLKYSDRELDKLVLGALIHDVGMLLVPKEILLKKERLSESEMAIIRKHCELGSAMITGNAVSRESKDIIMQHHERLDGSGYPNGLSAGDMTEFAQIASVADSFDSATTSRPYKKTKSAAEVLGEMRGEKEKYNQEFVRILSDFMGE